MFEACEWHNDTVCKTLLKHQSAITNKSVTFRYHDECRSQYVCDVCETEANNKAAIGIHDPTSLPAEYKCTWSHASVSFDWKLYTVSYVVKYVVQSKVTGPWFVHVLPVMTIGILHC